jgi:hypothetical protein
VGWAPAVAWAGEDFESRLSTAWRDSRCWVAGSSASWLGVTMVASAEGFMFFAFRRWSKPTVGEMRVGSSEMPPDPPSPA